MVSSFVFYFDHGRYVATALEIGFIAAKSIFTATGYDLALLGGLYASPQFNKKYGTFNEATGKWAISAAWQSGLSNGARAGEIFGLLFAGWTSDKYGYKVTTIGSLILMICFIFVLFFAPNLKVLVVGEILCGQSDHDDLFDNLADICRYSMGSVSVCDAGICF